MSMSWHLRGYERETGLLGMDLRLQPLKVQAIRHVLTDGMSDTIPVDPSELTPRTADRIGCAIGFEVEADRFDYFVEAEEDWRIVAAICESYHPHPA